MLIEYHLPASILDNEEFEGNGLTAEKIFGKTGIRTRRIAGKDEFALDLAEAACAKLFIRGILPSSIDYLIYCTQSPDYVIPNNSSQLQSRLGLPKRMGSVDINQGCTGFIYGLSLAKGLLISGQAVKVLLVTADTYSKYINPRDHSTRSIFGDGAAATVLELDDALSLGPFVFGTDGSGFQNLIVKTSGLRHRGLSQEVTEKVDESGNARSINDLYMNGPEIFNFTLARVPEMIESLLGKEGLLLEDFNHFVFHQANGFMLEHLRKKLKIPSEKFHVHLEDIGNTVSSSIPIVLHELQKKKVLRKGQRSLLVGFGVGYSWAATILKH